MNEPIDIKRISFRAAFENEEGSCVAPQAEFKLGLRPCGKEVTRLAYTVSVDCLMVVQECGAEDVRVFTYPLRQLMGRIVAEVL
jgi:hypothetical protein